MRPRQLTALLVGATFVLTACAGGSATPSSAVCGNGEVEGDEECDDSNTTPGDGCSSTCTGEVPSAECGNGVLDQAAEDCDDGNTAAGDGCSPTCVLEVDEWVCGDGAVNDGEECDDGNT